MPTTVSRLLAELAHVPDGERAARFRCVLALCGSPGIAQPVIAEGTWEGRIAPAPRGTAGFGYDPVFEDPDSGLTAAEMAPALKNAAQSSGPGAARAAAAAA